MRANGYNLMAPRTRANFGRAVYRTQTFFSETLANLLIVCFNKPPFRGHLIEIINLTPPSQTKAYSNGCFVLIKPFVPLTPGIFPPVRVSGYNLMAARTISAVPFFFGTKRVCDKTFDNPLT